MIDLRQHRDLMVQAILDLHWSRALETFPKGIAERGARAFYDSYRPYAAADVDAIISAMSTTPDAVLRLRHDRLDCQVVMDCQGAEIERLRAAQDATIRVLSDDRLPLQSRVNDARAILARSGNNQQQAAVKE